MKTARYFTDNVIYVLSICMALSFLFQLFQWDIAVDVVYVISLVLVFFCYIASGRFNYFAILFTALTVVSAVINGVQLKVFDYYTHVLISLCIYMCFDVCACVRLRSSTFKKIANLILITSLILIVAYYFGPLKDTKFNGYGSICLNLHNPNAAGIWLASIFILLVYFSFHMKLKYKVLYLGSAAALLPILLATESRNSFLAALLFVVCIVAIRFFKIRRVPKFMLVIITVLPLLVFFFYMFVIAENLEFWYYFFSDALLDKGLGSRIGIWSLAYESIRECFLFGNYYKFYNSQMHSSLMTIFCRFGAPVTALTCVAIYRALRDLQNRTSLAATVSLSAILFTGCFEASVFVGVAGLYLMVLILPACASIECVKFADPPDLRYMG